MIKITKKLSYTLCLMGALAMTACSKYDDSALQNRVTNVEGRVTTLEERMNQLNTNVASLQTLVTALETKDVITKVEPFSEGVGGYKIYFSHLAPITIYNGAKGEQGIQGLTGSTPTISVKKDSDGIYYWTLNDSWLLNSNNQKVQAKGDQGNAGTTPKFKIENDYWYVSYDNGSTWTQLGKAKGDKGEVSSNVFQGLDATTDPETVHFTLADGSIFNVPRYVEMSMTFTNTNEQAVFPNQTYEIPYTSTGVTADTQIKVIAQDGIKAKLFRTDATSGVIKITTPSTVTDSEVIVLMNDGRGYTKMYALAVFGGVLTPASDSYLAEKSGATLEVPIKTNASYTVEIPSDAQSWISYETLRAVSVRNEKLKFTVQANPNNLLRSAIVKLKVNGVVTRTITIAQKGSTNTYAVSGSSLEATLNGNFPYELKLTGKLTSVDFGFLKTNSDKIRVLDLSGLSMTNLLGGTFEYSKFLEVKLPVGLTKVPAYAFNQARQLQGVTIPDGVTAIGRNAFTDVQFRTINLPQGLKSIEHSAFSYSLLEGRLIIPASVSEIDPSAFSNCTLLTSIVFEGMPKIGAAAFLMGSYEVLNLDAVYVKSTTPKAISPSAFWQGELYGAKPKVLYVPIGCKAKYEALAGWNVFQRIEEVDFSTLSL